MKATTRPKSKTMEIPDLHLHYKGGKYRKLMEGTMRQGNVDDETVLFATHSETLERCGVRVLNGFVHIIVPSLDEPVDGVLYVSLGYGSIWVREKTMFEETIVVPEEYAHAGESARRFTPVKRFATDDEESAVFDKHIEADDSTDLARLLRSLPYLAARANNLLLSA